MKSGRQQLIEWIQRMGFKTDRQAAEYLGIHFTFLSQLRNGARVAGLAHAVHFEDVAGIPARAWLSRGVDTSEDVCDTQVPKPAPIGRNLRVVKQ